MRERLDYDENLEKNVKVFIKQLTQEAINCQAYTANKASESSSARKQEKNSGSSTSSSSTKLAKQKPVWPYPPHKEKGLRHYLKDCRDCPKDKKNKLFEELRSKKKEGVKRTTDPRSFEKESSVLFTATLDGKYRTTVCADIGSAATLMDSKTLNTVQKAGVSAIVLKLNPPRKFEMAAKNPDGTPTIITCTHSATIDTELHIRHGSALVLRNLRWLITPQAVDEPLLSRPLLEALGFDCHQVMRSASDRFGGSVDVSTLVGNGSDFASGRVGRIIDGVFHADGGADDADLDDDDGWLDLGPEDPAEKEKILQGKLKEAKEHGLSESGCEELEGLLREFSDTIKLKLDVGEPADIEPLKIALQPDAKPIRAKQRRYPQPKRAFLTRYVQELLKLGFVKHVSAPEWVSAPLVVPKRPPAMYRLTVDYRPINAVTRPTFWPMPNSLTLEARRPSRALTFAAVIGKPRSIPKANLFYILNT